METPTIIGAKEKKNPKSHILDHVLKIPLGKRAKKILIIQISRYRPVRMNLVMLCQHLNVKSEVALKLTDVHSTPVLTPLPPPHQLHPH